MDENIVNIRFHDGAQMTIYLNKFIPSSSVLQIKKLLKYIAQGDSPEEVRKVQSYVEQFNENYEECQKNLAARYVAMREEVKLKQERVTKLKYIRAGYKKKTELYKYADEKVQKAKEELTSLSNRLSALKKTFADRQRMKEKLDKISDFL